MNATTFKLPFGLAASWQTFLFDEAVPNLKNRALIFDYFAGAGGASTGIEWALGRSPDVAIDHCEHAVRVHELNHPRTDHVRVDVWDVDPMRHLPPGDVDLCWFSPDCRHFTRRPTRWRASATACVLRWPAPLSPLTSADLLQG